MEGNSNKCLQYPCSFPPPTWVDPYQPCSSSSSSVPKWVIAAIFIAVAILVFLFAYIGRRDQKKWDFSWLHQMIEVITEAIAKAFAGAVVEAVAKAAAEAPASNKDLHEDPAPAAKPAPKTKPTPEEQIYIPNTCPSCGCEGGSYKFTYLCPWCKYKAEIALAYPGPSGKK